MKNIIKLLIDEYSNHLEEIKKIQKETYTKGYDAKSQGFNEGFNAAYEEILQDLENRMREYKGEI